MSDSLALDLAKDYSPAALRQIRDHARFAEKLLRKSDKNSDRMESDAFASLAAGCDAVLEILHAK